MVLIVLIVAEGSVQKQLYVAIELIAIARNMGFSEQTADGAELNWRGVMFVSMQELHAQRAARC